MPLQSFGECPWCGAKISLRQESRVCACPVCSCTFTRNSAKWKVGIPVALLVGVVLWLFIPSHGRMAGCVAAIMVLILTAATSHHTIVSRGRTDLAAGEASRHKAKVMESKWFMGAVVLLVAVVLVVLVFGLLAKR